MRANSGVSCATTDASWSPFPRLRILQSFAARAAIEWPEPSRHSRRRVATAADLDAAAVHDVLLSIYRPMRAQPAEAMRVTFSLDLLLFRSA
jgi:hypothetical protein